MPRLRRMSWLAILGLATSMGCGNPVNAPTAPGSTALPHADAVAPAIVTIVEVSRLA